MNKYEKIGNVIVNYDFYSGNDEYSDGVIEDEMLEMIQNEPDVMKILKKDDRWPVLYHFSPVRQNIVEWYPFEENSSVLEIGAGCGAVTGGLCKNAGHVTSVDLSKKRSLINAYRNKEYDNLEIIVANFNDLILYEKYDYITLIGVLEYADYYTESDNSFVDFLRNIRKYLKPNGRLLIAIENKFGLKYWAGFTEDHTGKYFDGLQGYTQTESKVRTFSKQGLKKIIDDAGYSETQFFYPFPDYKFPTQVFSDEKLPSKSDVNMGQNAYDNTRLKLFNENLVYANIIDEGKFDFFANSFFVEATSEGK